MRGGRLFGFRAHHFDIVAGTRIIYEMTRGPTTISNSLATVELAARDSGKG